MQGGSGSWWRSVLASRAKARASARAPAVSRAPAALDRARRSLRGCFSRSSAERAGSPAGPGGARSFGAAPARPRTALSSARSLRPAARPASRGGRGRGGRCRSGGAAGEPLAGGRRWARSDCGSSPASVADPPAFLFLPASPLRAQLRPLLPSPGISAAQLARSPSSPGECRGAGGGASSALSPGLLCASCAPAMAWRLGGMAPLQVPSSPRLPSPSQASVGCAGALLEADPRSPLLPDWKAAVASSNPAAGEGTVERG